MEWFKEYHRKTRAQWIGAALLLLLIAALSLIGERSPLWVMHLESHNYPQGLELRAYGDRVEGDVNEINTLNQYIGMKDLDPQEIKAMFLCPYAVGAIVFLAALAFVLPRFRWLFSVLAMTIPLGILVVIQYYLYSFGHSLDPHAPLRMPAFTPHVIGPTTVWNFKTVALPGSGFWLLAAASLLIGFGNRLARSLVHGVNPFRKRGLAFPIIAAITIMSLSQLNAQSISHDRSVASVGELQSTIDAAAPGSTITVPPGIYRGPITIVKPLTLIGNGMPEIRGDGQGTVVTIASNDVTFKGFRVSLSGKEVSQDAAGILTKGSNIIVRSSEVLDVYFGVHVTSGNNILIADNEIHPGQLYGDRPGHAINVWNVEDITIRGNYLHDARDGVILTYVAKAIVDSNQVTNCRYGLHSMYSKNLAFTRNYVHDNLLGVALMYTDTMLAEGNLVTSHKTGATPFGFLLKDLNNLVMRHNTITCNRVGIYADGISMQLGSASRISENTIAGNERGLSAMSNSSFDFVANNVIDNLTDVYNEGERTSPTVHWSDAQSGNFWSEYHGFDRNGDGIGDLAYHEENLTESVLNTSNPARAFIYTPAHLVLDAVLKMFPLFKSDPVVSDGLPLMEARMLPWSSGVGIEHSRNEFISRLIVSLVASLVIGLALWLLWKWRPFHSFSYKAS
ncbi:MAG: nitrous oxide reductase family maturation protein NosD [Bacteroidota bacterium]|nr:nitrous oxide reductase family maturation protein NosD [Bacteroidota bacterium]MDP4232434.1 nitrous oxide reductase family maturation protein NosD [Bacteroidota bacterium]MDP4241570.1 nitrous oxide reductase family maturation protein NosD [Bacteroidota bacterium]MDP4286314.1 nitrous oxide reductase family maturation protein NosD [Bacteroidota bacterium]